MAGREVKGNTVAKHAGIHGLLGPHVGGAGSPWMLLVLVARVRWQLPQNCMAANLRGISSGPTPAGCYSAPAFEFFICIQMEPLLLLLKCVCEEHQYEPQNKEMLQCEVYPRDLGSFDITLSKLKFFGCFFSSGHVFYSGV